MAGKFGGSGAWKVAYADFVTAMMALFMVLWISAQNDQILISTAKYFQSPTKPLLNDASGVMPFDRQRPPNRDATGERDDPGTGRTDSKFIDLEYLNTIARELFRLLKLDEKRDDNPIAIQVTDEGLRITLYDRNERPLFEPQGSVFTEWGRFVMENLAWLIDRDGFYVTLEGHTRSGQEPEGAANGYSAWELSADRANAARRELTSQVVSPALIERVIGYADTRPLPKTDPSAESNRRVTLTLRLPQPAREKLKATRPAAATATESAAPETEP
ncbi:flagellar motor protein [Opitutaceae bacterium TAV1]|nr:flagellar motor protein [Opitutaceae bacterium TAV1]